MEVRNISATKVEVQVGKDLIHLKPGDSFVLTDLDPKKTAQVASLIRDGILEVAAFTDVEEYSFSDMSFDALPVTKDISELEEGFSNIKFKKPPA